MFSPLTELALVLLCLDFHWQLSLLIVFDRDVGVLIRIGCHFLVRVDWVPLWWRGSLVGHQVAVVSATIESGVVLLVDELNPFGRAPCL